MIYTMEQWGKDGTFSAQEGQEVEKELYFEMMNRAEPHRLPPETAKRALQEKNIAVFGGFLVGTPHTMAEDGTEMFLAFGQNDQGTGTKSEPHYFYLGLSPKEKRFEDGKYYFFDCMNAFLNKYFLESAFDGDQEAIKTAANYEATLCKYTVENERIIESVTLYEPI